MALSGSTNFEPNVTEFIEEAFERCGIELRTGYDLRTAKKPITKAFNDLKKHGIIGKHNYACCQSCGKYGFSCDKIENYIFYHNQCLDSFRNFGIVHMYHELKPEHTRIVIDAFEKNGCFVHWDRDHNKCISVSP